MDKRREPSALAHDERGATAIEYGLICAMIVLAMVAALKGVANANSGMWNNVSSVVVNETGR